MFINVKPSFYTHFCISWLKVWKWQLEAYLKFISWCIWRENWGTRSRKICLVNNCFRANIELPSWFVLGWFEGQVEKHDTVHKALDGIYCLLDLTANDLITSQNVWEIPVYIGPANEFFVLRVMIYIKKEEPFMCFLSCHLGKRDMILLSFISFPLSQISINFSHCFKSFCSYH